MRKRNLWPLCQVPGCSHAIEWATPDEARAAINTHREWVIPYGGGCVCQCHYHGTFPCDEGLTPLGQVTVNFYDDLRRQWLTLADIPLVPIED